jgi:hypothetical protein
MILRGATKNIPVTAQDLRRADIIHGPAIGAVKGKTHKVKLERVIVETIPKEISMNVRLHVDIMFVEGIPFLVSVSEPTGVTGVNHLGYGKGARSTPVVTKALLQHINKYRSHGFQVIEVLTDGEGAVAAAVDTLGSHGVPVNVNAPEDKVSLIERKIGTIKGIVRSILHSLHYKLAYTLLPHLVAFAVARINIVPNKTGYVHICPKEALTGKKVDYALEVRAGFGDYVEATTPNGVSNSMSSRTESAIVLSPVGNSRGSMHLLNLATFKVITKDTFKKMPMPQHIIVIMSTYAEKQKTMIKNDAEFFRGIKPVGDPSEWQEGVVDTNDPFALDQINPHHPIQIEDADDAVVIDGAITAVENAADITTTPTPSPTPNTNFEPTLTQSTPTLSTLATNIAPAFIHTPLLNTDANDVVGDDDHDDECISEVARDVEYSFPDVADSVPMPPVPPQPPPENIKSDQGPEITHKYNTRIKKASGVSAGAWNNRTDDYELTDLRPKNRSRKHHINTCKHHYVYKLTVLKAISKLGRERTVESIVKELKQHLSKNTWHPVPMKKAAGHQIIRSHMFLKEKFLSDGVFDKLKARLVAGGDMQDRNLYDDISSPTASATSLFMIAAIAAKENRHVCTLDIGGAYLNAKMGKVKVFMKLDKQCTEICAALDPTYEQYILADGTCLVQLDRALYGCIESSKLWYDHVSNNLISIGYKRNSYDKCIFNKTVNGHRITVILYVDDLKITSTSRSTAIELIEKLREIYKEITVTEGSIHSYLGMTFDYSDSGKVKITIEGYTKDLLNTYNISGKAASPALDNLFVVRDTSVKLDEEQKKLFHSAVAKCLYLAKRVRPDILVTVSFLASRVQEPDCDDWSKLSRLLKYINDTKHLGIILEPDKDMTIISHIDASYAVHGDMRSHAGTVISIGKGPVYTKSSKIKLMVKSSTEAEVVAASDGCTQVIWCREFLLAQGDGQYTEKPAVLYQDNKSAIHLLEHESSTSDRTRHVNIRYYWIRDKVDSKEINIVYIPTDDMIADILTKPLLGEKFRKLRSMLLNWYD